MECFCAFFWLIVRGSLQAILKVRQMYSVDRFCAAISQSDLKLATGFLRGETSEVGGGVVFLVAVQGTVDSDSPYCNYSVSSFGRPGIRRRARSSRRCDVFLRKQSLCFLVRKKLLVSKNCLPWNMLGNTFKLWWFPRKRTNTQNNHRRTDVLTLGES